MQLQTCKRCGETKPLTPQYFNKLSTGYWRRVCKICMAANTRRHYYKNPEKVIARVHKYREQKAAAGGFHDDMDIAQIRITLKDRCNYCGEPLRGGGEIDHLKPIILGGDNSPSNLTLACTTCNRDKHAKTAGEFVAWRRRLGLRVRRGR
jgi:5-methylcytosine-specific restriction endonuclease McrA